MTLPTLFPGNYEYPGNIFGSVGQVETVGISNYNSVQTSLERHFSHGLAVPCGLCLFEIHGR